MKSQEPAAENIDIYAQYDLLDSLRIQLQDQQKIFQHRFTDRLEYNQGRLHGVMRVIGLYNKSKLSKNPLTQKRLGKIKFDPTDYGTHPVVHPPKGKVEEVKKHSSLFEKFGVDYKNTPETVDANLHKDIKSYLKMREQLIDKLTERYLPHL